MRTTIALPDDLYQAATHYVGDRSFSQFVREAVESYVDRLERERLAREMEEGYRAEAASPSLDPAWSAIETEGWE